MQCNTITLGRLCFKQTITFSRRQHFLWKSKPKPANFTFHIPASIPWNMNASCLIFLYPMAWFKKKSVGDFTLHYWGQLRVSGICTHCFSTFAMSWVVILPAMTEQGIHQISKVDKLQALHTSISQIYIFLKATRFNSLHSSPYLPLLMMWSAFAGHPCSFLWTSASAVNLTVHQNPQTPVVHGLKPTCH